MCPFLIDQYGLPRSANQFLYLIPPGELADPPAAEPSGDPDHPGPHAESLSAGPGPGRYHATPWPAHHQPQHTAELWFTDAPATRSPHHHL